MNIPDHIIEKLNATLGVPGQSRYILWEGERIDTGCMEWTAAPSLHQTMTQISPSLQDTLIRWQAYLTEIWSQASRDFIDALGRWQMSVFAAIPEAKNFDLKESSPEYDRIVENITREFWDSMPPHIRNEFEHFMSQIGHTERLYQAFYLNGTSFMDTVTSVRSEEFFAQQPVHLQREFEIFQLNMERASPLYQATHPTEQIFNPESLNEVRDILQGEQLLAFKEGFVEFETPISIVVAPTTDQFDILRFERTDAINYGLETEGVINQLKILDERYGIDIVGATCDSVTFTLKYFPKGKEVQELSQWLLDFCPDLDELPQEFPEGEISLWWD